MSKLTVKTMKNIFKKTKPLEYMEPDIPADTIVKDNVIYVNYNCLRKHIDEIIKPQIKIILDEYNISTLRGVRRDPFLYGMTKGFERYDFLIESILRRFIHGYI